MFGCSLVIAAPLQAGSNQSWLAVLHRMNVAEFGNNNHNALPKYIDAWAQHDRPQDEQQWRIVVHRISGQLQVLHRLPTNKGNHLVHFMLESGLDLTSRTLDEPERRKDCAPTESPAYVSAGYRLLDHRSDGVTLPAGCRMHATSQGTLHDTSYLLSSTRPRVVQAQGASASSSVLFISSSSSSGLNVLFLRLGRPLIFVFLTIGLI